MCFELLHRCDFTKCVCINTKNKKNKNTTNPVTLINTNYLIKTYTLGFYFLGHKETRNKW